MSIENLSNIVKRIEEAREAARLEGRSIVADGAKVLFDQFPALRLITWTQYTPYFNDGDPCEFNVGDICGYADIPGKRVLSEEELQELRNEHDPEEYNNIDEYTFEYDQTKRKYEKIPTGQDPNLIAAFNEFSSAIHSMGKLMQDAIGDHCEITITRDGMTVDDYDHE